MSLNGTLYGTTDAGGAYSFGTVFELTPPASAGGSYPQVGLLLGNGGALYGTTVGGGIINGACYNGCGVVFQLKPPGPDSTRCAGECSPGRFGLPGCGVVFQLTPATGGTWTETILHNFMAMSDGARPFAGVVVGASGALFGTASQDGQAFPCCGMVFGLKP